MWFFIFIVFVIVIVLSMHNKKTKKSNYTVKNTKPIVTQNTHSCPTHSNCRFNTEKMQQFKGCFLIEGDYINLACMDILSLNDIIMQIQPNRNIRKTDLRIGNLNEIETNCHVVTLPLTPGGKLAKFPQKLNFFTTDHSFDVKNDLFGEVYYLSDGSIGKAEITIWTGDICTIINAAIINGTFSLNRAYRIDSTGVKKQIYKAIK